MGAVNALAIGLSCFAIVSMSVAAGTVLPFALQLVGLDPAHAGASVQATLPPQIPHECCCCGLWESRLTRCRFDCQVFMDVMGCLVTW